MVRFGCTLSQLPVPRCRIGFELQAGLRHHWRRALQGRAASQKRIVSETKLPDGSFKPCASRVFRRGQRVLLEKRSRGRTSGRFSISAQSSRTLSD
jgi:hypothetical protein